MNKNIIPEKVILKKVKEHLTKNNFYFIREMQMIKIGVPDIIACKGGRFIAIECKSSVGKLSKIQEYEREKILKAGGTYYVINDVEQIKDIK